MQFYVINALIDIQDINNLLIAMSAPRLNKERQELEKENYIVQADNLVWIIYLAGPEQSPYEGGSFQVEFKMDNFPFKPPTVSFKTPIYHPNIDEKGQVCEDMIETGAKWAPTKKLVSVMEKLKSMLAAPSPDNAFNAQCAQEFQKDKNTYIQKAKQHTQQHAK